MRDQGRGRSPIQREPDIVYHNFKTVNGIGSRATDSIASGGRGLLFFFTFMRILSVAIWRVWGGARPRPPRNRRHTKAPPCRAAVKCWPMLAHSPPGLFVYRAMAGRGKARGIHMVAMVAMVAALVAMVSEAI